jgi:DsbC/DsbD-like thiol-disulfide interchange protein
MPVIFPYMISRLLLIFTLSYAASAAQPGRAAVEWISSSATVEPGKPLHTAIRMTHVDGWHSYWINPGEAGMPTSAGWKLPPGWKCGGLELPAPIRFLTGGLAGYGYEGTVLFPVTLTPPADFSGEARLSVTLSWLACGEEGCVPGERELHLDLRAGIHAATEHQAAILKARQMLPQSRNGMRLDVSEKEDRLTLSITGGFKPAENPGASHVYPATPEVIDPQAEVRFRKDGARWMAEAPLHEFATQPVKHLELVLEGGGLNTPLRVVWTAP